LRSGEEKDLRAIVAKGIKATGGEANFLKYKAIHIKGTGTFYGLGEGIPYTGEWHFHEVKQSRFTLDIKVMDQNLKLTQIVNGDKGWMKFNDDTKDMSEDELAEEKASMYSSWVSRLVPLKDKEFKLAALGDVKVEDKDAVGVRVTREGKRDVNLYFDKGTGLLLKSEFRVKDVKAGNNKEMTQETLYTDYKAFQGTKHATKIVIKRDGKLFVEANMTEYQPLEKIDDGLFARP